MEWYAWFSFLHKADTMHLTAEQDGIYRRLIDHYMETRQPLPNNDAALMRIAGVNADIWDLSGAIIRQFFQPTDDNRLRQKRCDIVLAEQDRRIKRQSEKGKKGAEKRWKKSKEEQQVNSSGYASAIAEPLPANSKEYERTREDKKERKESKVIGSRFTLTEPPKEWIDYVLENRPDLDAEKTFTIFKNHFVSLPGKDGIKTSWFPVWQNWVIAQHVKPSTAAKEKSITEDMTPAQLQEHHKQQSEKYKKWGIIHTVYNPT